MGVFVILKLYFFMVALDLLIQKIASASFIELIIRGILGQSLCASLAFSLNCISIDIYSTFSRENYPKG